MNPKPPEIPTLTRGINRRSFLSLTAGTLLAGAAWPGRLRAADNGKGSAFSFVALNDVHFSTPKCPGWMERVTASIKTLTPAPELCLMIGDLADGGIPSELGPMRDALRSLGMPFHTVIGNHDYVTDTDRAAYEELFPGTLNYHFEHRGWQFVALDTTFGTKFDKTNVQPATFGWLDQKLPTLKPALPTVLFTHFPLGAGVPMRPLNADAVLDRFKDFNLAAVLNGHHHGFTERTRGATVINTNRCCSISKANHDGSKEKGYFLCRVADGKFDRKFVELQTG